MRSPIIISLFVSRAFRQAVWLLAASLPSLLLAQVNHRPTIGYVPNQRITAGSFAGQSVTVGDDVTALNSLVVTVSSSDNTWYASSNVVVSTTGASRTITFNNTPSGNGVTTITLTVTDGGTPAKSSATAFTLQRASSASGTSLARIPNWTMPVNTGAPTTTYGPVTWVVQDSGSPGPDGVESAITPTATSTGTIAPTVSFGGQNYGRTVTVTPPANQSGRATVTLRATDGVGNTTYTAFVLDAVASNSAAPVVTSLATFQRQDLPATNGVVAFAVSDSGAQQTNAADLRITVTSSNQSLVPDTGLTPGGSGGSRNVTVTPTASTTGAATITINVSDGDITRQAKFLYVVYDPAAATNEFARSNGVFILDSGSGTAYTTTFGKSVTLRDANIRDSGDVNGAAHVTGFTLRVFWDDVESSTTAGAYDFHLIENAMALIPAGQFLSIIVVQPEPTYVAAGAATTWNDAGTTRAVPWDPYLQARRQALIEAMAAFEVDSIPLAVHPRLLFLDPYLPGGHTGIRDPNSANLSSLPGYSRANLLAAVQQDLHVFQDNFPGKTVQLGFFKVLDSENASYGGVAAWEWLRGQLLAEFDDSHRPRVGFFMELLASTRPLPEAAYTATPVTAFGQALYDSRNDTWSSFQMLGSWTNPFNDGHVGNTINGTPYEAMEYGYGTYNSRYTEVYIGDMDNTAFIPVLQGWHDYLATIAAPTGLMAMSTSSSAVDVAWNTVPGATSYTLQRRTVGGTFATIYTGATAAFSDSGLSPDTEYAYRVNATTSAGTTPYAASFPATTLPSSPVTLLTEDFEANFNNWTDGGSTDWDRTSTQKHAGTFSAHAGSTDNDLISDNLNTTGYSSITIDFWYRDDDIDDDDDVYLQLFDGTSYDNRLELGLGAEDTWQHATITLNNSGADAQYFHANFRLKFEGTSIDSGENLWIDDVTVTAQ